MRSLDDYIREYSDTPDEILKWLIRETNIRTNHATMLTGEVQGKLLEIISKMLAPSKILELGTFTGYSAICLARGLKERGEMHAVEINDELCDLIDEAFERAGVADKIIMHYGDAKEIIPRMDEQFDLVYIDANKREYCTYYDLLFDKVRTGGVILADNVLWHGKMLQESVPADAQSTEIARFNAKIKNDSRVEKVLLPLRDGLYVIRKK